MFNCGVELVHTYNLHHSKSHRAVQSIVLCVLDALGPKVDGEGSTSTTLWVYVILLVISKEDSGCFRLSLL
jgi:hypothetical protein